MTPPTAPTAPAALTLRQFVALHLGDTIADTHAEAKRISDLIPDCDRDGYLVQAILGVIREVGGQRRRDAFDALHDEDDTDSPGPGHETRVDHGGPARAGGSSSPSATSRPSMFRDRWRNLVNSTGVRGGGVGIMRIGDMGEDDLRYNIAYRERLALTNMNRAAEFRELLDLLLTQGVSRVDDIEIDEAVR